MKQVIIVEKNKTPRTKFPYVGEYAYNEFDRVIALVTGDFKGVILSVEGNSNDSVGESIAGWAVEGHVEGLSVFEVFVPTDITLRFEN